MKDKKYIEQISTLTDSQHIVLHSLFSYLNISIQFFASTHLAQLFLLQLNKLNLLANAKEPNFRNALFSFLDQVFKKITFAINQ